MKITFSNLGTIKKTELDLRPLTVIIGPNNSSKTYVAYSVYGMWQLAWASPPPPPFPPIGLNSKLVGKNLLIELDEKFATILGSHIQGLAGQFSKGLDVFFQDSSHKLFAKTAFSVQVSQAEILDAVGRLFAQGADGSVQGTTAMVPMLKGMSGPGRGPTFSTGLTVSSFVKRVTKTILSSPFLLPAERNAFVITYKMLANRRYRLLKDAQRELFGKRTVTKRQGDLLREQGDIRYPKPIEDFLDFMSDVDLSDEIDVMSDERIQFYELADEIELSLQGRTKMRFRRTALGGREIKIDLRRGLSIDLYNASSSIKQLAPLLLYLRYRAKPNDFLIIDEPEMNLHPESQAKLLEVLGILVNLGIRVLITTHSPYFMSHLNNLVAGDTAHPDILQKQASSLYLQNSLAFLPMEQVSAYEMRANKLCSLKDEDYGIRWDTLSDVSSEIQQRFFEISDKGRVGRG